VSTRRTSERQTAIIESHRREGKIPRSLPQFRFFRLSRSRVYPRVFLPSLSRHISFQTRARGFREGIARGRRARDGAPRTSDPDFPFMKTPIARRTTVTRMAFAAASRTSREIPRSIRQRGCCPEWPPREATDVSRFTLTLIREASLLAKKRTSIARVSLSSRASNLSHTAEVARADGRAWPKRASLSHGVEYPMRSLYLLTSTHDFSANKSLSLLGNFSSVPLSPGPVVGDVRGRDCARAGCRTRHRGFSPRRRRAIPLIINVG